MAQTLARLCRGEALQDQLRYDASVPVDRLMEVTRLKTGSLFQAACLLGAQSFGAGPASAPRRPASGWTSASASSSSTTCWMWCPARRWPASRSARDFSSGTVTAADRAGAPRLPGAERAPAAGPGHRRARPGDEPAAGRRRGPGRRPRPWHARTPAARASVSARRLPARRPLELLTGWPMAYLNSQLQGQGGRSAPWLTAAAGECGLVTGAQPAVPGRPWRAGLTQLVRRGLRGVWVRGELPTAGGVGGQPPQLVGRFRGRRGAARQGRPAALLMDGENLGRFRFLALPRGDLRAAPRQALQALRDGPGAGDFPEGELRRPGRLRRCAPGAAGSPAGAGRRWCRWRSAYQPRAPVSRGLVDIGPAGAPRTCRRALAARLGAAGRGVGRGRPAPAAARLPARGAGRASWDERISVGPRRPVDDRPAPAVTGFLLLKLGVLVVNVVRFPVLRRAGAAAAGCSRPAEQPAEPVSLLIPVRNEAAGAAPAAAGLLAQDADEVIVLDDESTDGTADWPRRWWPAHPQARLMPGTPAPGGWCGKNWACQQLAARRPVRCWCSATPTSARAGRSTPCSPRCGDSAPTCSRSFPGSSPPTSANTWSRR